MRFLVTGAGGMLGRDLVDVLGTRPEHRVTPATRAELDIADAAAVHAAVDGHDVVVNTAAWTDVDGAEAHESAATAVNGDAVVHLATACAAHGARLLHLSTDYVFDGTATAPYPEDAPTAPLNAYGRGKLVGEQAVTRLLPDTGYVVRTAWLYGRHGRNFVTTMLDLANRRDTLDVVDDQRGQPTWSHALARHLVMLAEAAHAGHAAPGIYHGTCSGEATWYDLARAVFARHGLDPERIRPTTSARFVRPAPRPTYSVLGHGRWARAGLPPLPDWHATLADAFAPAAPPSPWKVV
ncbi:dTDP-4-dehydrorhamnose reductase [Micromonospora andamanensis]|uniref:dTDP-4-dehydrorhamnose reductase n=1 Tax=Micromonospora andamanensis TaxID=1287068 RepID=UPI0019501415|nr:dTDP-4-dehydrorhamnose reductase [Micromonospora andamanensis]GIJ41349.1 NAD(P)-dependent oxidoreductase [Micromonospora andamanensis]